MPLTTIPPIADLPSVSDTQEDFSAKAFNAWPQLNATSAAINALAAELASLASTVESQTTTVQTAQDAVLAAANYAGEWSGLTGALGVPASTTHDGHFWILTAPVADVTAEEPSDASLVWTRVVSDAADFLYDGPAVGLAAENVAAALGELKGLVDEKLPLAGGTLSGDVELGTGVSVAKFSGPLIGVLPPHSNLGYSSQIVFQNAASDDETYVGIAGNGVGRSAGWYGVVPGTNVWGGCTVDSDAVRIHSSVTSAAAIANSTKFTFKGVDKAEVTYQGVYNGYGVRFRQGLGGAALSNVINLWWTGTVLQLWVDSTLIGTVNVTP